jgi:glycosyltransferase involved in cell wall biosynthesis
LRQRTEALGLSGVVRFLGRVTPVAAAIERVPVVVVPSLGEGFGMVALEAMERGRAVIASDVGGLPEIVVHGETGLIVPKADPDALAAAIVDLVGNPVSAAVMGAAGRERACAVFSQERCTTSTRELYEAALARSSIA